MALLNELRDQREDLDNRLYALELDRKPIREQLGNLDRTAASLRAKRDEIHSRIEGLSKTPSVSDHAVIRYLERKHNFCFEDIRGELLSEAVIDAMRAGVTSIKAHGGTLKIKEMKVVTFAP